jgi:hypothetical protein
MLAIKPLGPAGGPGGEAARRGGGRAVGPFHLGWNGRFFRFSAVFPRMGTAVFAEILAGLSVAHGALIKEQCER